MKVCNAVGCKQNVWAENFCKFHQWMRSDIAQIKREGYKLKKQKGLKKYSEKGLERQKEKAEKAVAMWKWIKQEVWDKRPHYSEVSGTYLGEEFLTVFADHLLEKAQFPELAKEPENIALVTFEEHERKTNGNPLPKHQELIDKAKEKFLK